MRAAPEFPVEIDHIRKHYDRLSFLYRLFWGEHLHHGYWDADQSAAQAQVRLMERLAEQAHVPRGARVLDIGCGLGGSAFWLADQFDCNVIGMTISPVQARMANKKAKARGLSDRVQFQVKDANQWQPEPESVGIVWIMESSEHFRNKKAFFQTMRVRPETGRCPCRLRLAAAGRTTNVGRRTKAGGDNRRGDAERKFG